jgi:hypothetical protein
MTKAALNKIVLGAVGTKLVTLPFYASEQQIAEFVLGERHERWRDIARHLEERGMPARSQLMAGLRYVPKVLRFFERTEFGISHEEACDFAPDGEENWKP